MFKQVIAGLFVGLFANACAVESADEQARTSTTEQSLIWRCDGSDQWIRRWYNSGVQTGQEVCSCTGLSRSGQLSGTYQQTWTGVCGGGGGGGGGGGDGCDLRAPTDDDGETVIQPPPPC